MTFVQDECIPDGLYYIQNVARKSWIGLPPRQKYLSATSSPEYKWRITLKSNNKYDFQSCPGGFFAQCEPRPKPGNSLFVQPEHFEWVVKQVSEVSAPDCYLIYPSANPRVMWSLRDSEESTPIDFALIESNQKNWWMFKQADDSDPDPIIMSPGALADLTDQFRNTNIDDLAQTRANLVPPRSPVPPPLPTRRPAKKPLPTPPEPHHASTSPSPSTIPHSLLHPHKAASTGGLPNRTPSPQPGLSPSGGYHSMLHPNKAASTTGIPNRSPGRSPTPSPQPGATRSKYSWLERDLEGKHPVYRHERLASSLHTQALSLSTAGYREEALESIEKAVDIRRHIAKDYSETGRRNLVSSLILHSRCLVDSGRYADALSAAEAGVAMHHEIGNNGPERSDPELAAALCALAEARRRMCKRAEAVDTAHQSVRIFRNLCNIDRETYSSKLAGALRVHCTCLRDVGRFDQALREIEQSVTIFDENPGHHEADLADALSMQAALLFYQYRGQDALNLVRRSITIYRHLPHTFRPGLVTSLVPLSDLQGLVGNVDEALTTAQDAVRIQEELACDNPTAHNENLGRCYMALSIRMIELGRVVESLEAAQNGVHIYRTLVTECDKAHNAGLVLTLINLCGILQNTEPPRTEDAIVAAQEAIDILQTLEVYSADSFDIEGAIALSAMGRCAALNNKHALSLELASITLKHYTDMSASNPKSYSGFLADTLKEHSGYYAELGRNNEALDAIRKTVAIWRSNSGDVKLSLGHALTFLTCRLVTLNLSGEALRIARESVEIFRGLVRSKLYGIGTKLVLSTALMNVYECQHTTQPDKAMEALHEAIGIRREVAAENPAMKVHLISALEKWLLVMSAAGQYQAVLNANAEIQQLKNPLAGNRFSLF
ncbi:hypothetical protein BD410DRAFT_295435 [Rickenella mellea]|uniref:Anaphase-promoting complex subunit 5 domain-containing protein n=1 Tax=Rickenella mellea TaxID=50990 RepID=A0A4Y7Q324_9AGAM|nr:hypothetical protein BD410DRAFT_295435 [Rickenella mellea]